MEIQKIKLAQQIRSIREYKGYSQEVLAQHLGISQQAYQKIESGITRLSKERFLKITKYLELEVSKMNIHQLEEMISPYDKIIDPSNLNELRKEIKSIKKDLQSLKKLNVNILKILERVQQEMVKKSIEL